MNLNLDNLVGLFTVAPLLTAHGIVETCVDVLVFSHGPRLRSTLTAHGITDNKSLDEEAELIDGNWGQIHQPIKP